MTNFFILIIVAPVLYILLGTVFAILATLLKTDNLKLKIVLLTFFRPLTYTFLLSLLLPALFDNTWIWLSVFALAVVLRDIIFSNQKFLSNVSIHNNKISVEYINTFLQIKSIDLSLDNAAMFRLSEMKSIANYPASLKIGDSDAPQKYIILTRKIWEVVNTTLNAGSGF
jgi:hypothetical protein